MVTVSTVVTAPGPNDHGSVTARRGHSSVTARSRLGHSSVTARSQLSHGIFSHGWVTAQSWPRSRLSHGWLWPFWSRWAATVANFFLMGSYLMNGMADWHGTKGMWVDRMLDPCCDFQCSPLPWPWPWIFKVIFRKSHISGMGWPIDLEWKGCGSIEC